MRSTPLPLLLAFSTAFGLARAQEAPGAQPHPPPSSATPQAPTTPPVKGPNLQLPPWIGGEAKTRLEAAISGWEAAYEAVQRDGRAGLTKVQEAITALEGARGLDEHCALPDYYLGIARQITGEFPLARRHLEEALKRKPDFHEAMVELGDASRWDGDDKAAARNYDKAIEAAPDYAIAFYMRSLLRASQQKLEDARQDAHRAKELDAKDARFAVLSRQLDLVLDGPPWERKFELESRHYIVRTNVSQELCDEISHHAELIYRLYDQLFPRSKAKRKAVVVVFKDRAEYMANGGPDNAGGHFDPVFKQLYLYDYPERRDTLLVLYHEGFHQFLDGVLEVKPPQWFNEGLADYFGPAEYFKEGREEGMRIKPNPWRLSLAKQLARSGDFVPFERLMTMTQAEMYTRDRVGQNYAQAWSMIYFLAEAEQRAYAGLLKDYFQALRKGKDLQEAYQAAFGRADMAALTERWRAFLADLKQ